MKHLDLFSGIGGFALAASWVWGDEYENVGFVEIDEYCQKLLAQNFKGAKIHGDIRTFKHTGRVDILTGGFPCQPFSQAGKRKGKDDNRFLWPEMLRVIQEVRPKWIVGENVGGIFTIDGGLVFEQIHVDLGNAGYEVQAYRIPAVAVNAPHRRDRWWFVARNTELQSASEVRKVQRSEQSTESGRSNTDAQHFTNTNGIRPVHRKTEIVTAEARIDAQREFVERDTDAADTESERGRRFSSEERGIQGRVLVEDEPERSEVWSEGQGCSGKRNSAGNDWNRPWIEVATEFCRVDDGVSHRVDRLKGLGNAIVPQVAEVIFKAIKEQEQKCII